MHPAMKTTKVELIELLTALSAAMPSSIKPTARDLEARLVESLDKCQYLHELPDLLDDDEMANIPAMPLYKFRSGTLLVNAVQRGTLSESFALQVSIQRGIPRVPPPGQEIFASLRQNFTHIAKCWDVNDKRILIHDKENTSRIYMRADRTYQILSIHQAAPDTPLLLVLYAHALEGHTPDLGASWSRNNQRGNGIPFITSSVLEQQLLLRLLQENAKRIPAKFKPSRDAFEDAFELSFLLPIGPLGLNELPDFRLDACAICRIPATTLCGGCQSIRYCSPEHAKQGWRSHKSVCKSLRGAEWVAIPFTNNLPGSDPDTIMTTASIRGNQNIQASRLDGGMRHESDVAPPNPHGSQPFILKVQTSLSSLPAMLIYDEERALESHVFSSLSPPDAWNKVHSTIRAKGVRGGIKLYFWARRHGDNEVAVAVDRLPEQNFPW